jgi:hypothetical protein
MADREREALLQETFRLNHELGYVGFREEYFNDPETIREWPDPDVRERELRAFWDKLREGRSPSCRKGFANDSVEMLAAYRDYLRGLLAGGKDGQVGYYNGANAMARSATLSAGSLAEKNEAKDRALSPSEIAGDPATVVRAADRSRDSGRGR